MALVKFGGSGAGLLPVNHAQDARGSFKLDLV